MARTLLERRYWDRVRARIRRRNAGVMAAWGAQRPPPFFIDYWTEIPASLPEKFLFAALIRRNVNFYFSYYWGDFPYTEDKQERFRPDFILPDYKIIIEAAGYYWHTRPGMYEYDAAKYALFIAAGWDIYIFTDFEILEDVEECLDRIPQLINPIVTGNMHLVGDRPFDPKAAITGRMRRYPKVVRTRYKRRIRARKGIAASWKPDRPSNRPAPPYERIFTQIDFDERYVTELREWGEAWKDWLDGIGDYFVTYPDAVGTYPDLWEMYDTWKDWWNRFTSS